MAATPKVQTKPIKHTPASVRSVAQKKTFKCYLDSPFDDALVELPGCVVDSAKKILDILPLPELEPKKRRAIPGLHIGLNGATRALEKGGVSLVLLAPDQDPMLVKHIVVLCKTQKIHCFSSKVLIQQLSTMTKIKRITAAAITGQSDTPWSPLVSLVKETCPLAELPETYLQERVKRLKSDPKEKASA
jgi:ribosomal protein L7Ae-like RNA K-turn-binding protein